MMIAYAGSNGEVIVCDEKDEAKVVQDYFTDGGRDLDEYDRSEPKCAVVVTPTTRVEVD